jgi:hypothetical protein
VIKLFLEKRMKMIFCNNKHKWRSQFVLIAIMLVAISCNSNKKKAKDYLYIAEQALEENNFEVAKTHIDSIKILFPKAFDDIRAGFDLMQDIRKAENRRNIAYIDSMINVTIDKFNEQRKNFDFVRDKNYQEFGNYIPKLTPSSSTLEQNTLRSGVSEKGVLYLESILSGLNINHSKIKASTPDGSYAESLTVTADGLNYKITTRNKTYEIVRFFGNDDNGVAEFIYTFQESPITINYIGRRSYSKTLSKNEKKAIAQAFELSKTILERQNLTFEKGKSEALLRYLERDKAAPDN